MHVIWKDRKPTVVFGPYKKKFRDGYIGIFKLWNMYQFKIGIKSIKGSLIPISSTKIVYSVTKKGNFDHVKLIKRTYLLIFFFIPNRFKNPT